MNIQADNWGVYMRNTYRYFNYKACPTKWPWISVYFHNSYAQWRYIKEFISRWAGYSALGRGAGCDTDACPCRLGCIWPHDRLRKPA